MRMPPYVVRDLVRPAGNYPASAKWVQTGPALGQPSSDSERDQQVAEIDSIVRELAVELKLRADRLVGELEVSQDAELRVGIPIVGQDFAPGEMAEQVALVSRAMADVAGSILSGPLSTYASEDVNRSLDETRSLLEALETQAQQLSQPIAQGHEGLAEEHLLSYVEDLKTLRDSAERLMVATEKAPQVLEPGEKELLDASGILTALGVLSVGTILVYLVASD
jgi:hypothetical protein